MNQSYLKRLQEVRGDLDSLARSIDTQLQTNCREEQRSRLELRLSIDEDISTVVSGFGQLSTFVAQEVPRLIQSRDDQILAVQEACKALHANQQVLTGILQNQNGLVAPPYPPISSHNPQSSSGNPRRPIQARGAPLGTATSRTTTASPSAASILSSFPLHLAGSRPPQDERPV
jgi:hypothetical protein